MANEHPVADAGLPRYAATEPVQLDGSNSYDPDASGPLSYAWTQISGPLVSISAAHTATPTVGGFIQTEEIRECEFELIVNDGQSASLPDTARIVIVPAFTDCAMTLENSTFDPGKPTVIFFWGGTPLTGGGELNDPVWSQRANIISFPRYVLDPGTFPDAPGAQPELSYQRPGDRIIVYLSAIAPDYCQPIQTLGFSLGGLLALDVALRLNLTYADARYAVNHVSLLDPSAHVFDPNKSPHVFDPNAESTTEEFLRRVALLLANPVAGEQCWVASHEAVCRSVCPSALNVVFAEVHWRPFNWYRKSLVAVEETPFNHGVVAGAYWSVLGPGRNLQLASTPGVETYKFNWIGSSDVGQMVLFDESKHPGRLPEPVTLAGPVDVGNANGAVLTCLESENAVGYELLLGSDAYRAMDYTIISDTPTPPDEIITTLPFEKTWWTVRVRDAYGSTIYADPKPIRILNLSLPIENTSTGKRYGHIQDAINDAVSGDELVIGPGTYHESISFENKDLEVRSTNPNDPDVVAATVIYGVPEHPVVTFSGGEEANCVLDGFTISGGIVGISCPDVRPTIRNCTIGSNGSAAIEFWEGCEPTVIDCTVLGYVHDRRLLAHWALDETVGSVAYDSAAQTHAAVMGDAIWQPEGGQVGGVLQCDGIDDYLSAPFILNPIKQPFSVFAWVKGGQPGQAVISQQGAFGAWLSVDSAGALATGLTFPLPVVTSEVVITDDQWHHIGLVSDGAGMSLYVDDIVVARSDTSPILPATGDLHIGAGNNLEPGTFWSGLIDDARIYDRVVVP